MHHSGLVYLDNNATTRVSDLVLTEMRPYFSELYGNPASAHAFSSHAREAIELARLRVAELVNAKTDEIIFTSGGTESNNLAIRGMLGERRRSRSRLLYSSVEHSSVREVMLLMESEGYQVDEVPVDQHGCLELATLDRMVTEDTALVSVMLANNETGVVFPIWKVAQIAAAHGALLHVDAVQAAGKLPLDVADLQVDALSISSHKMHGPKGTGAIYVRHGTPLNPIMVGGGQERGLRPGTEAVPQIVGFGAAAKTALEGLYKWKGVEELRDFLEDNILATVPGSRVNGHAAPRLANTSNISFEFVEADALVRELGRRGICISSGAACNSNDLEPSSVLKAMGVGPRWLHGSIRFSLSQYTNRNEIEYVVSSIAAAVCAVSERC
jgi:cysteine desulfurase